jgi:hypothetical protein
VRRRGLIAGVVCALVFSGVAWGAVLSVDGDELTLVRVPGFVPAESCTVGAVADAHVDEATPDGNFGSDALLTVGAGTYDSRALVRFDVSSCSIPSGADVRSARLRMVLVDAPGEDRTWKARRVTGAWTEGAVTWNTEPALAAASTADVQTGTVAGATLEWDVLPDVAGIVSGALTDRGWRIADSDEAPASPVLGGLASREEPVGAQRPELTVTWFD